MTRAYVETAEVGGDYQAGDDWYYAMCGWCDWEGPGRATWAEAERDRRWHTRPVCWARRKAQQLRWWLRGC